MILADTSVWVQHLRHGVPSMARALNAGEIVAHPFVTAEIALGHLPHRKSTLALLAALTQAPVARDDEILAFIEMHRLIGLGIGLVDVHLLASAALAEGVSLWTWDRRLGAAADAIGRLHRDTGDGLH